MGASASGGKRGQGQYLMEVGIFETLTEVREGTENILWKAVESLLFKTTIYLKVEKILGNLKMLENWEI